MFSTAGRHDHVVEVFEAVALTEYVISFKKIVDDKYVCLFS